jgi:osmotically inducible lipoprotein OsmB
MGMNTITRMSMNVATAALLFGMAGCTVIGAGIGAVAGSGTAVGVVGGAVIGGVVGYQVGK